MEDPYGRAEFDPWGDAFSDSDDEVEDGDQPADVPATDHMDWFARMMFAKFQASRVYRLRIPFESIVGARLVALDCTQMLVLDLASPPPPSGFAVRCVNNQTQQGENEWTKVDDWTPGRIATRGTRHYIQAGGHELQELADYLCVVSPRMKGLLNGQDSSNTLFGDISGTRELMCPDLRPSGAMAFDSSAESAGGAGGVTAGETEEQARKRREDAVHRALKSCGVKRPKEVALCLKKAIFEGHVDIGGWLRVQERQIVHFSLAMSSRCGAESPAHCLPGEPKAPFLLGLKAANAARSALLRVPGRFYRSSDWLCWHRRYHVQDNSGGPEATAALQSDATADRRTKPAPPNPGDSRLLQLRALYRLQSRRRSLPAGLCWLGLRRRRAGCDTPVRRGLWWNLRDPYLSGHPHL